MFFRYLAVFLAFAALSGCNQISAGLTSADEKINAAFPLKDTVKATYESLVASLGDKPAELKTVTAQFAKLMGVRAMACTAKFSIGRFDTVAKIKDKVTDSDCFQKQDAQLAEWAGLQRLSLALSKPALVPLSDLPDKALLPNFADYAGQVTVAGEANVMVVKGAQQFTAVQLPGGKVIHSFPIPEQTYRPASLSGNGHVLAVPVGSRSLRMIEVETGNLLWSTEGHSDLIAWLPQVQAALLTQTGTGMPQLLDVKNGTINAFPATEKRLTWAIPVNTANGNYLVGTRQTVSQMNITRTAQGTLEAAPVNQWRLTGSGVSSAHAFLMEGGTKLVYQSGQDLGWLSLKNQEQGVWQLSAIHAHTFAKLSEKSILFDAYAMGATAAATRLLDISEGTVATAKNMDVRDGTLVSLLPRSGYLRRSESSVTLGTAVEVETPQRVDRFESDALLAKELAKVAALTTSNEQFRSISTLLTDVPSNARIYVVGVYEGTVAGKTTAHSPGSVRINVQPGSTPLILVLANYEPVHWLINTNGRKISKVLTSGYHDATISGAEGATVIKIGSKYAYKTDSHAYLMLKKDLAQYIANPVQLFQGAYTGREFSVN